jgi:hypothetical protein
VFPRKDAKTTPRPFPLFGSLFYFKLFKIIKTIKPNQTTTTPNRTKPTNPHHAPTMHQDQTKQQPTKDQQTNTATP